MERLRRESNPRIHSSHKEENPIKTRDRCGLPLIPPKAWTGGLSITTSRKRRIGASRHMIAHKYERTPGNQPPRGSYNDAATQYTTRR